MANLASLGCLALAASAAACLEAPPGTSNPPADSSGMIDAAPGDCPDACDSCDEDSTCVIHCGEGECGPNLYCPAGRPCRITCEGYTACENVPIDCSAATRCEIHCLGHDACQVGVRCGGSSCRVECVGTDACSDGLVECSAGICDILCDGDNACTEGVCCHGGECGPECVPSAGGCCSCAGCV